MHLLRDKAIAFHALEHADVVLRQGTLPRPRAETHDLSGGILPVQLPANGLGPVDDCPRPICIASAGCEGAHALPVCAHDLGLEEGPNCGFVALFRILSGQLKDVVVHLLIGQAEGLAVLLVDRSGGGAGVCPVSHRAVNRSSGSTSEAINSGLSDCPRTELRVLIADAVEEVAHAFADTGTDELVPAILQSIPPDLRREEGLKVTVVLIELGLVGEHDLALPPPSVCKAELLLEGSLIPRVLGFPQLAAIDQLTGLLIGHPLKGVVSPLGLLRFELCLSFEEVLVEFGLKLREGASQLLATGDADTRGTG